MKKVFISGKITGLEERDWRKKFSEGAYKLMLQHGYKLADIIAPSRLKEVFPGLDYEQHMRVDLTLLDMCDAIYMLDNYKDSMGAQRELAYAIEQNKKIIWGSARKTPFNDRTYAEQQIAETLRMFEERQHD